MRGGHAGVLRSSRSGLGSARRAAGPRGLADAVGTTKSRWRTRAKAHTAPTNATTAPMSMRWFSVVGEADLVGVEQRLAGRRRRDRPRPPGAPRRRTWPPGAARRPGGAPRARRSILASAAEVCVTIWLWNTAPSTAMPVAMPTWRNVLLAPDAMPLRWGWTTETAPEARTGFTMPTPKPARMNPGSSTVQRRRRVGRPHRAGAHR